MTDLDDLTEAINSLSAATAKVEANDSELRGRIIQLGSKLKELVTRASVSVRSAEFTIEELAEDDRVYGFLAVGPGSFYVAYRTRWDDMTDAMDEVDEDAGGYKTMPPEAWSVPWLREIVRPVILKPFIDKITAEVESIASGTARASAGVRHVEEPPAFIAEVVDVATELSFHKVAETWREAVRQVVLNPVTALRLASVLLETTLKHIHVKLEIALPGDKTITGLFKNVKKILALVEEEAADDEIRGMLSGLSSIVQNIGTHRTKQSDAHGRGPEGRAIGTGEASLCVNSAGVAATFLMRRTAAVLRDRKKTSSP